MDMAVVGFDLGFQNSYVAVARAGGIETVANEYSDRCTASCVSFTDTMRFIGNSARQRTVTNMKDTLQGFAKFVGKNFNDPSVQAELPYLPYKLAKLNCGGVGFRVSYLGLECVFTAEQVVAMMLTKLKSVAESNLSGPVVDCVLNVPTYYDDRERRSLLTASQIAGLNCLRLVSDVTAIALNYCIYQKDLPQPGEPPRHVMFVDMGHCNLQVGLVAFNAGQMRVLSTASDPGLGGRDLDRALFNHFVEDFANRLGLDVRSSLRAQLKLMEECSRVKKLMSATSTDVPLSVECLLNERDAAGSICRAEFARLLEAAGHLRRVRECVRQCLAEARAAAGGASDDVAVDSVELVGGSTRVPAVKSAIVAAFAEDGGQPTAPTCRTTLNADEAVARGCALACALLSPGRRVRQQLLAGLVDRQPYAVSLVAPWLGGGSAPRSGVEAFAVGCDLPSSRVLRLPVPPEAGVAASVSFDVAAGYTNRQDVALADRQIAQYRLAHHSEQYGGHLPQPGHAADIFMRLNVQLDAHGLFALTRAKLEESEGDAGAASQNAVEEDDGDEAGVAMTGQQVAIRRWSVPLTIEVVTGTARLSGELLAQYRDREAQMARQEALEHERIAARNSVEEYVYEMRDRLAGGLAQRLTEAERVGFADALSATEAWLYGEGERLGLRAYADRLAELRRAGEAYLRRAETADAKLRQYHHHAEANGTVREGDMNTD